MGRVRVWRLILKKSSLVIYILQFRGANLVTLLFLFCCSSLTLLQVRFTFATPSLQVRSKLDASPFHRMGEKWELHRVW